MQIRDAHYYFIIYLNISYVAYGREINTLYPFLYHVVQLHLSTMLTNFDHFFHISFQENSHLPI